ncbi:hypothetical protein GCM10023107_01530 [Actinoplanes octamycinicus]
MRLITMPGDEEEAQFIAEEIHERNAVEKIPWEDFAILFRTNGQSRNLESAMREMKIPYRMVGAQSFFDRKEVRDCIAYLQVLNSPISDVPLLRILNAPPRGIGQGSTLLITEASRERECSIWEAMGVEDVLNQLSTKVKNSVNTFVELVLKYHERILKNEEPMGDVFKEFLEEVGYEEWMRRHCKTDNEKQQRAEGIHDLLSDLNFASSKNKTLQKFLDTHGLAVRQG